MPALVPKPDDIRLAIIGMTDGNGHPYSWSAIFNGYDRDLMTRECPFASIPQYLNKQPPESLAIPGAKVTHISCVGDGGFTAEHVARCSQVPKVVNEPADVIGEVDAVLIAMDKGSEHVERARPFVEAGLPVFVDKPLCDNEPDLKTFHRWVQEGRGILTSSGMRYAREFMAVKSRLSEVGELRLLINTTPQTWERYGIHAAEGLYPILGPGYLSVRNTGDGERNVVHCKHRSGADVILISSKDMYGGFCRLTVIGTKSALSATCEDTFYAFKSQLQAFVNFLRTGDRPFPWPETVELMKIIIGGIRSRDEGGREVRLEEIWED